MSLWRRFLSVRVALITVLIYSVLGFVIIPLVLKYALPIILKKNLNAESNMESLYFNPYSFELELKGFNLLDNSNRLLFGFGSFYVNLEPSALFNKLIVIKKIDLNGLYSTVRVNDKKVANFQYILDFLNQKPKVKSVPSKLKIPYITINTFNIKDSTLYFKDESKVTPYVAESKSFNLSATNISTTPNTKATVELNLDLENTLSLKSSNSITPIPLEIEGDLELSDLQIDKLFTYVKDRFEFNIEGKTLSNTLHYHVTKDGNSTKIKLSDNNLTISSLIFSQKKLNIGFEKLTHYTKMIVVELDSNLSIALNDSTLNIENITYTDGLNDLIVKNSEILLSKFNLSKQNRLNALISHLQLNNTKVKNRGNSFVSLDKLQIDNIDAEITKNRYVLDRVAVDKLGIIVDLFSNSKTTFDYISAEKTNKENATKTTKPYFLLKHLDITESDITFNDRQREKLQTFKLNNMDGTIVSISSDESETAILHLKSNLDKQAVLIMDGQFITTKPLQKSKINFNVENIDLISITDYSSRFIARKIDKGKFEAEFDYYINDYNLSSINNLKIKDLKLGEKVESKEAIDAPVGLAIALLKDTNGLINLNIPIHGDIKDPKFSLGETIRYAIGNVLTKIVSAPFRLLGALLGIESDKLSNVTFKFAGDELTPSQKENLNLLVQALQKRPALKLSLTPTYNKTGDTKEIQIQKVNKKILERLKKSSAKDVTKSVIIKELYDETYRSENDKKELELFSNSVDFDKIKITEYMRNKLIDRIEVSHENLLLLGSKRAESIKNYLISKGIKEERIIIKKEALEMREIKSKNVILKLDLEA